MVRQVWQMCRLESKKIPCNSRQLTQTRGTVNKEPLADVVSSVTVVVVIMAVIVGRFSGNSEAASSDIQSPSMKGPSDVLWYINAKAKKNQRPAIPDARPTPPPSQFEPAQPHRRPHVFQNHGNPVVDYQRPLCR